jgi:hypothetical protein
MTRVLVAMNGPDESRRSNDEFIAHARQDVPELVTALRQAYEEADIERKRRIRLQAELAKYIPEEEAAAIAYFSELPGGVNG